MSARENKPAAETPDFERALARLEALVKEMESGNLNLDRMMACFEEGSQLVKVCEVKLNEVEKKIEKLLKKGGEVKTEPFSVAPEGENP